jgi:hypothetical protein
MIWPFSNRVKPWLYCTIKKLLAALWAMNIGHLGIWSSTFSEWIDMISLELVSCWGDGCGGVWLVSIDFSGDAIFPVKNI